MTQEHYRIIGGLGSPYSMKMRAIFRYRRIPHLWVQQNMETRKEVAHVRPPVIPIIQYPDGTYHNDSTPMIYDLEARHTGRSIVPEEEGQAFLAYLIEDMADEWLTKMMFHYRWFLERDQKQMSLWLAFDTLPGEGLETIEGFAKTFRDRQVGHMALVGCTAHNQQLIEQTCTRLFELLEAHVTGKERYLFGARPSLADFSIMGQFSQLAVDPTPCDKMRAEAPFLFRWLMELDDLSGLEEGAWRDPAAPLSPALEGFLQMAGEVYLPFLEANKKAYEAGEETFRFEALGLPYEQGTFRYQVKCLSELRHRFQSLSGEAKARLEPALEKAGLLTSLSAPA